MNQTVLNLSSDVSLNSSNSSLLIPLICVTSFGTFLSFFSSTSALYYLLLYSRSSIILSSTSSTPLSLNPSFNLYSANFLLLYLKPSLFLSSSFLFRTSSSSTFLLFSSCCFFHVSFVSILSAFILPKNFFFKNSLR